MKRGADKTDVAGDEHKKRHCDRPATVKLDLIVRWTHSDPSSSSETKAIAATSSSTATLCTCVVVDVTPLEHFDSIAGKLFDAWSKIEPVAAHLAQCRWTWHDASASTGSTVVSRVADATTSPTHLRTIVTTDGKTQTSYDIGIYADRCPVLATECVDDHFAARIWSVRVQPKTPTSIQVVVQPRLKRHRFVVRVPLDATTDFLNEKIAAHTNVAAHAQRLVCCGRQLECDRPLSAYPLNDVVHVCPRLYGGGGGFEFNSLTDLKKQTWSESAPPWRRATAGLNLEGKCMDSKCKAHNQLVIVKIGLQSHDVQRDAEKVVCPLCHSMVRAETCAFSNCRGWADGQRATGEIVRFEAVYYDDAYHRFDESGGVAIWQRLVFHATVSGALSGSNAGELTLDSLAISGECSICLADVAYEDACVLPKCNHSFHEACVTPWIRAHENCPYCRAVIRIADIDPKQTIAYLMDKERKRMALARPLNSEAKTRIQAAIETWVVAQHPVEPADAKKATESKEEKHTHDGKEENKETAAKEAMRISVGVYGSYYATDVCWLRVPPTMLMGDLRRLVCRSLPAKSDDCGYVYTPKYRRMKDDVTLETDGLLLIFFDI